MAMCITFRVNAHP